MLEKFGECLVEYLDALSDGLDEAFGEFFDDEWDRF